MVPANPDTGDVGKQGLKPHSFHPPSVCDHSAQTSEIAYRKSLNLDTQKSQFCGEAGVATTRLSPALYAQKTEAELHFTYFFE
jgi:hypothetical protein